MSWKIVQCCEAGIKHAQTVCQDSCFCCESPQCSVMSLCDGTSDARLSDLGAMYTAEFSAKYFHDHFDALYSADFSAACAIITEYHQQLLMYLSQRTQEHTGVPIITDRRINGQQLRNFCTTMQLFAIKNGNCIYLKAGNGAAVIVGEDGARVLSDSSTESPTKHITYGNTLSVLGCIEFKRFCLNPQDSAVILMTDGVEFAEGPFCNHSISPAFCRLQTLLQQPSFGLQTLREYILQLKHSPLNLAQDDIGISVFYNDACAPSLQEPPNGSPKEKPPAEPTQEPTEQPVEEPTESATVETSCQKISPQPQPKPASSPFLSAILRKLRAQKPRKAASPATVKQPKKFSFPKPPKNYKPMPSFYQKPIFYLSITLGIGFVAGAALTGILFLLF